MENKKISASGYGFAIVSTAIFEQYLKENQIKEKKIISYFSKNNNAFYDLTAKGAFIPIHHLNYDRYSLYFSVGQFDERLLIDWNIIATWEDFNLKVDNSNFIWAIDFEEMEKWNISKLKKAGNFIESVYYDINDNEHIEYKAIKFILPEAKYNVKIYGLKRKIITEDGRENYGFLAELIETNELTSKIDISEINFREIFKNDE